MSEREAARKRHERWRKANPEHVLEYAAKQRQKNREKLRIYSLMYYYAHRDTLRARQNAFGARYRKQNRAVLAEKQRERQRRNPNKHKERLRQWRFKNRKRLNQYQRERRRLQALLPGITEQQIKKLKQGVRK